MLSDTKQHKAQKTVRILGLPEGQTLAKTRLLSKHNYGIYPISRSSPTAAGIAETVQRMPLLHASVHTAESTRNNLGSRVNGSLRTPVETQMPARSIGGHAQARKLVLMNFWLTV